MDRFLFVISNIVYWSFFWILYRFLMSRLSRLINKDIYSADEQNFILNKKFPRIYYWLYDLITVFLMLLPFAITIFFITNKIIILNNGLFGYYFAVGFVTLLFLSIFLGISLYTIVWTRIAMKSDMVKSLVIKKQLKGALGSGLSGLKKVNLDFEFKSGLITFALCFLASIIIVIVF